MPTVTERIVMPSQDAKRAPDARRLSRRSLLHGVATAGAAGIAVTALSTSPAMAATSQDSGRRAGEQDRRHGRHPGPCEHEPRFPDGPIMVHVRDARSGDIELFCGDGKTRLHDQDLAARIARALQHSS
jgi:hypothetical protein